MFMEERHQQIAEMIEKAGKVTVAEITEKYGISGESARRDLRLLEQKGICKRTFGGAIRPQQVNVRPPMDRDFSAMPVFDTYREIAKEAVKQIREHDVIYLTGGSFGHILIAFLPKEFHYTVVVNSVETGKALRDFENVDVYVAGGKMRRSGTMTDTLAAEFIRNIHFDCCFMTGAGLTAEFGLTNGTDETAAFQRAVMQNSRRRVLLMPGVKVGADAFIKVCDASEFDFIITDWECVEEQVAALEEKGISVTVVEECG